MSSKFLGVRDIARRWWLIIYPLLVISLVLFLLSPPNTLEEIALYFRDILTGTGTIGWHSLWLGQLWFIFPYMLLIALSPILNHAIRSMSRKEHMTAILILSGLFIAIPTINAFAATGLLFTINDTNNNLAYFIALYFVAAYVRKYDVTVLPLKGITISLLLGLAAFALTCVYTLLLALPSPYPNGTYDLFQGNNTLFIYAGSIFLFLAIRSVSFHNSGISFAGKLTYDAFLFHSVVTYFISVNWPEADSVSLPAGEFFSLMLLKILLVLLISLGYGLARYYMDAGLTKLLRRGRRASV
jgi:surface polysaccharide O-acyltransferase-like enzyme